MSQGLVLRSRCLRMKFGPQPFENVNGICVGSTVGPGVVSCIILITVMRPRIEIHERAGQGLTGPDVERRAARREAHRDARRALRARAGDARVVPHRAGVAFGDDVARRAGR